MDQIGFHPAASTPVHLNVKTNTVTLSMHHVYMAVLILTLSQLTASVFFFKLQKTNLECVNIKNIYDIYKLEKKWVKIIPNLSYESTVSQLFFLH